MIYQSGPRLLREPNNHFLWENFVSITSLSMKPFHQSLCILLVFAATSDAFSMSMKSSKNTIQPLSRSKFLSSTAATFLISTSVLSGDPESCAAKSSMAGADNPRYIDGELQMKYGEDSSAYEIFVNFKCTDFPGYSNNFALALSPNPLSRTLATRQSIF